MPIYKNYKIAKLRKLANHIGREGVSIEAINAVKDFDGSYKSVMELAGKLTVIADMSTFDEYWEEQVNEGVHKMTNRCLSIINNLDSWDKGVSS